MLDQDRRPWVISLVISAVAHIALLAWVGIDIPDLVDLERGVDRSGSLEAEEAPVERVVQVIRIQPPGLMRSGGSQGGGDEGDGGSEAGSALILAPLAAPQSPRGSLAISPAQPKDLALIAPERANPGLVLADLTAARKPSDRSARPNRGLVVRGGSSGNRSKTGRFGAEGSGRSGAGLGGSGATSIGAGTDCITAGTAIPGGRLPNIGSTFPTTWGGGASVGGGTRRRR